MYLSSLSVMAISSSNPLLSSNTLRIKKRFPSVLGGLFLDFRTPGVSRKRTLNDGPSTQGVPRILGYVLNSRAQEEGQGMSRGRIGESFCLD